MSDKSIEERLQNAEEKLQRFERAITGLVKGNMEHEGRITALEEASVLSILNFASLQPDPFGWVQGYIETQRQASKNLVTDAEGPARKLVLQEVRAAMEATLEQLVLHAGQLPGAPKKQ